VLPHRGSHPNHTAHMFRRRLEGLEPHRNNIADRSVIRLGPFWGKIHFLRVLSTSGNDRTIPYALHGARKMPQDSTKDAGYFVWSIRANNAKYTLNARMWIGRPQSKSKMQSGLQCNHHKQLHGSTTRRPTAPAPPASTQPTSVWQNGVPRAMPGRGSQTPWLVSCVVDWLLSPLCSGVLALYVRATSRSGRSRYIRAPALKSRSMQGPPPAKAGSLYIQATPLKKQVYVLATSCKSSMSICGPSGLTTVLYMGHLPWLLQTRSMQGPPPT
jgi:hypothetical protein